MLQDGSLRVWQRGRITQELELGIIVDWPGKQEGYAYKQVSRLSPCRQQDVISAIQSSQYMFLALLSRLAQYRSD